jgi:hypothetical protein
MRELGFELSGLCPCISELDITLRRELGLDAAVTAPLAENGMAPTVVLGSTVDEADLTADCGRSKAVPDCTTGDAALVEEIVRCLTVNVNPVGDTASLAPVTA